MEEVKVGNVVWFITNESKILFGTVTEVHEYIVHINVKIEGQIDADEYAMSKNHLHPSRSSLLKSFDKIVGDFENQQRKYRRNCDD